MRCLNLKLTYACTNRCSFCFSSYLKDEVIGEAGLLREVEEGYRRGCRELVLSGGEPTLCPDTLLNVNRDHLGDNGKALCDELRDSIYPGACDSYFSSGTEALASEDYETAIEDLGKVVRMDQSYNSGQAVYNLAQAYQGNGDNENALTYYQMIIENFADSEYVQDAQENYDALSGSSNSNSSDSGDSGDNSSDNSGDASAEG